MNKELYLFAEVFLQPTLWSAEGKSNLCFLYTRTAFKLPLNQTLEFMHQPRNPTLFTLRFKLKTA